MPITNLRSSVAHERPKFMYRNLKSGLKITMVVLIATLSANFLVVQSRSLQINPQSSSNFIKFKVIDANTNLAVQNATIILWDISIQTFRPCIFYTDNNGEFIFEGAIQTHLYWVYVYKGKLDEGTILYAPQKTEITLSYTETNKNVTIKLVPGAAVYLTGLISVPESASTPTSFRVTIVDPTTAGDIPPKLNGSFISYYDQTLRYFLREEGALNSSFVFVPAGVSLSLRIDFSIYSVETGITRSHFYIPIDSPLSVGSKTVFRLEDYSLKQGIENVKTYIFSADRQLRMAQDAGFYLSAEARVLQEQLDQVMTASKVLSSNDPKRYEKSWSVLRDALGKTSDVLALIDYYVVWASANAVYLPAFFAVYSVIFAFFLFEDNRKKYISSLVFYGVFLLLLYLVYPGVRIIVTQNVNLFIAAATASVAVTLGIVYLLTSRWKLGMEGVVSMKDILTTLFSVGKRQIKIKKARSLLTLTSLVFLVLAFTALTSFGWVYGVTSAKISHTTAATGYLMKKSGNQTFVQGQTNYLLFMPMDVGYYNRLSQMLSLVKAAPKIETYPTESPIAKVVSETGKMIDIRGVVGIDPINEKIYTNLDTIVAPGSGIFLDTEDPFEILISSSAASALKITTGETVRFLTSEGVALNCTVKGIFSDTSYIQILDLDGQPFGPKTIIVKDGKPSITLCNATNVVFMNWNTAINLQRQINLQSQPRKEADEIGRFNTISRIAFSAQVGYGINEIVSIVVNNLYCDLYVADGSSVTRYYVGFYYEAKGAIEIVFPLAMSCLNIAAVMLNAVYERRKEMKILTVMGGNPGHIAMLFVSEAIILGMVGGGLGYLFGLGFYRVMSIFGSGVIVREKIEWWWSVLGLAFAVIASVLSTLRPALLAVKMYTPSKVRKIKTTEEEKQIRKDEILKFYQARGVTMPLKVNEKDAIFFFNFLYDRLQALQTGLYERIDNLQEMPEMQTSKGQITKCYTFTYAAASKGQKVEIKNEIRCSKDPNEDYYRVQLISNLENMEVREEQIQRIAEIIRDLCLDWAKSRSKIVG